MSYIERLSLQHFRNYTDTALNNIENGFVILCGPNGAGKTNILEAVSLLSAGRGLRSAKPQDMQNTQSATPWGLSASVQTDGGTVKIGTGLDPTSYRRAITINGVPAKSQAYLNDYISCIWLTPQMDRLFLDTISSRRRFLDRMVFTFDPSHSGRVTRYENAMRQRAKLLEDPHASPEWLKGLEAQMATTGIAIAAARLDLIDRLQKAIDFGEQDEEQFFPKARLEAKGTLEELLNRSTAIETEQLFQYQLEQTRDHDRHNRGTSTGPHKTDLHVFYASCDMIADQCSTGEQKALLIGLILAQARMMAVERGFVPIVLLDEIAAHLDDQRRHALFDRLHALNTQVWMTGTTDQSFEEIKNHAQFFRVLNAEISLESSSHQ